MSTRSWLLAGFALVATALGLRAVSEAPTTTTSPLEVATEVLASAELRKAKGGVLRVELLLRDVPQGVRVGDRDHLVVVSLEPVVPPGASRPRIWQTASGYHEGFYPITKVRGALAAHPSRSNRALIFLLFSDCTSLRVSVWDIKLPADLGLDSVALEELYPTSWVPEEKLPQPTAKTPRRHTVFAGCVVDSSTREVDGNVELQVEMSDAADQPIRYLLDLKRRTLNEVR